jgi:SAM-dependent methyltransferase
MSADQQPLLYTDLAPWFHLLTAPSEYAEEAEFFLRVLTEAAGAAPRTLLELGSGGGNMASHYKQHVAATLADLSPAMLAISRGINPECEHVQGDMRAVRLGRQFDAVLVHDAVDYMASADDLRRATATAFLHCRPGGAVVFAPDHVRETFQPSTEHGGHDGDDGRALRYLMWTWDPDPTDATYLTDFAYLLHEPGQPLRSFHDRHVGGLFPRATWLGLLEEVGFRASARPHEHPDVPPGTEVFVGVRPGG